MCGVRGEGQAGCRQLKTGMRASCHCLNATLPSTAAPTATTTNQLQAKMREAEDRRKREAAAEKEQRAAKNSAAAARPKFSFKLA